MNPVVDAIGPSVAKAKGAMSSAVTLINSISSRLTAAVAKALENGATEEQLKPVVDEVADLNSGSDELAKAVADNP